MPLDFATVSLQAYCAETSTTEKLHAAVILDTSNSRMKDFFDIHWLSNHQEFNSSRLLDAIRATFEHRDTQIPTETPLAYTNAFAILPDKQTQRKTFLKKGRLEPLELAKTVERISEFLSPLLESNAPEGTWNPKNGWTENSP